MALTYKLCPQIIFTLVVLMLTSFSLNKEARCARVLAMDVEASGSSFSRNGILSIGCSLQDENSNEEDFFQVNISLPDDREYERECLENFWLKNPEAHQAVQTNPKIPQAAMRDFCDFLDKVEVRYTDLLLVSDNPSFDIAWINTYLAFYTDRKPLNYSRSGEYRMIWDSAAAQKTWMAIKIGDFDSRHGHIRKLGYTSKWEHDHTSLSDARRIADFFNQARREMRDFVAKTSKKVEVVPYNPEWSSMFEGEALALKQGLGDQCLDVYHIGSTSVPGLAAKPIIDIILEVKETGTLVADKLAAMGYQYKGEFNIPMRALFGRKTPFEINLHVYEPGNPEVELNLRFRDFLRSSEAHRLRYELLKMRLVNDPSSQEKIGGFTKYALGKNEFITEVISQIGFRGICPRFCTHYAEWDVYHTLRQQIAGAAAAEYSRVDPVFSSSLHHHLVLYRGADIIGVAHVDASRDDQISEIKFFHIKDASAEKALSDKVRFSLEKWSASKGRKLTWEGKN